MCASSAVSSPEQVLGEFEGWLRREVASGDPNEKTLDNYLRDARQHLRWIEEQGPGLALFQAGAVTRDTIKRYRQWLLTERFLWRGEQIRYNVDTVSRKLVAVRWLYRWLSLTGQSGGSPAEAVRAPRKLTGRETEVAKKVLTPEEIRAVLALPDPTTAQGLRDRALLLTFYLAALRTVEVHRLDVGDVDLGAREMLVRGKFDKRRLVPLSLALLGPLVAWLEERARLGLETEAVFVSLAGARGRLSRRGIRAIVDGYLERAGAKRPGVSCHAFRHSFATHAYERGQELKYIGAMLGHNNLATTQIYARVTELNAHNPAEALGEVVGSHSEEEA
jgi:integrase/recombinase XerD